MSPPLVYLSEHRIKEGRREEFEATFREAIRQIEAEEPRLVAQEAWLSEDGSHVTILHVFPDSDSMELHMELARQRIGPAMEVLEPVRMEVYGSPGDTARQVLSQSASAGGLELLARPRHLGGFIRPAVDGERADAAPG